LYFGIGFCLCQYLYIPRRWQTFLARARSGDGTRITETQAHDRLAGICYLKQEFHLVFRLTCVSSTDTKVPINTLVQ
jgi:hypothetical protein